MRAILALALIVAFPLGETGAAEPPARPLPAVANGWSIELVAESPRILYPTAIVAAADGTIYLGSDPMDMPGPPTEPSDRVVAIQDGRIRTFADQLWSVMGLEWVDGTLYVVHAPFLSAFRDTDGDGQADQRLDLITGLGPKLPGASGLNDHIASGIRLGMDGFLYIAVGDKGIPRGVGRDGTTIQLFGGGVIRIRPDGTGLEVVSTGERNPMSVALSATDEIFTYGNDDDSKKWPNSLTHHIVGGHYGYPYQFLSSPRRSLPIMAGQIGGAGAQGICYNEDGLPPEYRGNLFFCDWGLQAVLRFEIRKTGGTFAVTRRTALVTKGEVEDFRPFSLAVSTDGASLWLVDWAFNGWRAAGPRTGRLYRLRYSGAGPARPAPRPSGRDPAIRLRALDHPALAVRLESQRLLAGLGPAAIPVLADRLTSGGPEAGRLHALWALDAIGGPEVRRIIGSVLSDSAAQVRLQAIRSVGIRHDRTALPDLVRLLRDRDAAVRREAAIAIGKLGDVRAGPALFAALDEADRFAAWSVRGAIRRLDAWEKDALVAALLDDRRRESALALSEEAWAVAVVEALTESLLRTGSPAIRARLVANLAGQYRRYPEWSGSWFGPNPLAGRVPEKTRDWSPQGMEQVRRGLALGLADRDSSVRAQAIAGLGQQGRAAAPWLRAALVKEPDPRNQAALAETLGRIGDAASAPILALLLTDANRPEVVRAGALEGLSSFRDRQSLRARLTVIYDPNAPARLVARALSGLAGAGLLPPNDLASFLENPAPAIRAAALLSLNVKQALPAEVQQVVLDRLDDPAWEVREAAILAVDAFRLRAAVPRLVAHAGDPNAPDRASAIAALCRLPDPRGRSIYEAASRDRNPHLRQAAESALRAIGDRGPAAPAATGRSTAAAVEALRQFAMRHDGDPRRGEEIFFDPKGVGCGRCHCASGQGTATIGPDLTGLASKYNRAELIRSVLEPSSRIAPGYQPAIVALRGGKVVTGVVRAETKEMLELADAEAKVVRIPKRDIEVRRSGAVSIMPEHLADSLTPIEFTDLISFLASLKPTARPTAAPAQP